MPGLSWLSFEQDRHTEPLAQLRLQLGLHKGGNPDSEPFLSHAAAARAALQVLESHLQRQTEHGWVA